MSSLSDENCMISLMKVFIAWLSLLMSVPDALTEMSSAYSTSLIPCRGLGRLFR